MFTSKRTAGIWRIKGAVPLNPSLGCSAHLQTAAAGKSSSSRSDICRTGIKIESELKIKFYMFICMSSRLICSKATGCGVYNVYKCDRLTLSCSGARLQEEPLDQTGSSQKPHWQSDGNASEKRAGPAQSCYFAFADPVSEYKSDLFILCKQGQQLCLDARRGCRLTCGSSCPVIRLISGGLGSMYVVSCVTKCTWCGSCHGVSPAWCRNTMAYSVPFLRVFFGKDTLTNLEKTEAKLSDGKSGMGTNEARQGQKYYLSNLELTSNSSSLWTRLCPPSALGLNAVYTLS